MFFSDDFTYTETSHVDFWFIFFTSWPWHGEVINQAVLDDLTLQQTGVGSTVKKVKLLRVPLLLWGWEFLHI